MLLCTYRYEDNSSLICFLKIVFYLDGGADVNCLALEDSIHPLIFYAIIRKYPEKAALLYDSGES